MTMPVFSMEGPLDPVVPLLLDSPHSGSFYPPEFRPAVGPHAYRRAEDMDVDVLFDAAPGLGAPLLKALFGRLFVDVNRARDDLDPASVAGVPGSALNPSAKAELGKGVVWMAAPPNGQALYDGPLDADAVEARLATYWDPYRQALSDQIARIRQAHGRVYYIDCHSMQAVSNVMHEEGAGTPRADVVLGDRKGTSCSPAFTALAVQAFEAQGFGVAINVPYQGADLVRSHGNPAAGFHALQVELNRALYMDEEHLTRNARFNDTHGRIGRALGDIVERLAKLTSA